MPVSAERHEPMARVFRGVGVDAVRNQFTIDDIFVDHIFPYRVKDYLQYRYVREWYFRWMPAGMYRGLDRRLGWHLCVTAHPVALE